MVSHNPKPGRLWDPQREVEKRISKTWRTGRPAPRRGMGWGGEVGGWEGWGRSGRRVRWPGLGRIQVQEANLRRKGPAEGAWLEEWVALPAVGPEPADPAES